MAQDVVRILLAEDNPGDARTVRELAEKAGSLRATFKGVENLLALLDSLAREVTDVVLLDLTLPDVSGLEAVERACEQAPGVPIVVLAPQEDEKLALDVLKAGAQDFLVKGRFDGAQLARTLRYAIERKRVERELARHASYAWLNPHPVIETDLAGKITYLNHAAQQKFPDLEITGTAHAVLEGIEWALAELRKTGKNSLVRLIAYGGRIYEEHLTHVAQGGHVRIYVADVTEYKRAEEKLRAHSQELERLNRLMLGREAKMIELKEHLKRLEEKLAGALGTHA